MADPTILLQPGALAEAALRRLAQPYYLRVLVVVSAPLTPRPPLPSSELLTTGEGEWLPSLNFQQEWADLRRAVLNSRAPILLVRLQPPTLGAGLLETLDGMWMIVDGTEGVVISSATADQRAAYEKRAAA